MSLIEEIEKRTLVFGKMLSASLEDSLNKKLRESGTKVQESQLQFYPVFEPSGNGYSLKILANKDYWYWIENGRKPGKMPSDKVGRKWQVSRNINPVEVIYNLQVEYNNKKGLKWKPKKLQYDKASKSLAYIVARKIRKFGYKAKPFIKAGLDQALIEKYNSDMAEILGREFTLNIEAL